MFVLDKFCPKISNCFFQLKFGPQTNLNKHVGTDLVLNNFFHFRPKVSFLGKRGLKIQIWSKKSKFSVEVQIWYLDESEYAEFNSDVYLFSF